MAKKTINVKPVSEIELQFEDGKSLTLRFDVKALVNFNDLKGGLTGFIKEKSLPTMCAKIIYIGAKAIDDNFTYEEAIKITSELDPGTVLAIINDFSESMGTLNNGGQNEVIKKYMEEMVKSLVK